MMVSLQMRKERCRKALQEAAAMSSVLGQNAQFSHKHWSAVK